MEGHEYSFWMSRSDKEIPTRSENNTIHSDGEINMSLDPDGHTHWIELQSRVVQQ